MEDIYDKDGYVYVPNQGWRHKDTIELHELIEVYRQPEINSPYLNENHEEDND